MVVFVFSLTRINKTVSVSLASTTRKKKIRFPTETENVKGDNNNKLSRPKRKGVSWVCLSTFLSIPSRHTELIIHTENIKGAVTKREPFWGEVRKRGVSFVSTRTAAMDDVN